MFGIGVIVLLCAVNIIGVKESAGVNIVLAVTDFLTQLLLVLVGIFLVFSPADAGRQRAPRRRADVEGLLPRDPGRHDRLHGHRDDLEHGRGGRGRAKTIPAAIKRVVIAVFAIYAIAAGGRAVGALPVIQNADGQLRQTLLGLPRSQGGYAGDPILGVVKQLDLGRLQGAGELYVGILAATILIIATNAGIIGVSRLVYSMGLHRQMPDRLRQLHPQVRHARGSGSWSSARSPASR